MKKRLRTVLLLGLFALKAFPQNPIPELVPFSSSYIMPVDIGSCGDDRLFIVEQAGKIWICDSKGNKSATPFLDITSKVNSHGATQGLLGLAFDPAYKSNGYFYVDYTNSKNNVQISRFQVSSVDSNTAKTKETKILSVKEPYNNHNGGCIKFGPDGYLYIAMGDGGSEGDPLNNGQKKNTLLGKILRVDVEHGLPYTIPSTNPFTNNSAYKPEIWALGVRNPWRFSFDHATGDFWIGDVGQDKYEEVDFQPVNDTGGENYGWRCYEGNASYRLNGCGPMSEYTFPVATYDHFSGDCAVTGGFVYRGSLYPNMEGKYFCSDYCSGKIRMIYYDGSVWQNLVLAQFATNPGSFGQDMNEELYVAGINEGIIYHLVDKSTSQPNGEFRIGATAKASLVIYPNPATSNFILYFNAEKSQQATIEIFNAVGEQVLSDQRLVATGTNTLQYSSFNLNPGIYFVNVHCGSQELRAKLIVR